MDESIISITQPAEVRLSNVNDLYAVVVETQEHIFLCN